MKSPTVLQFVRAERVDRILTITIARPEVGNALHPDACRELGSVLDCAESDSGVSVCVLTGEGDRFFSTGFDLQYAEAHPEVYSNPDIGAEIVRRPDLGKPILAAVNGLALGLGFELALACDLIIAAPHAAFGLPEVKVGLAAMGGGITRLTRAIGVKRALGMALTAREISAQEGYRLGFVNAVSQGSALDCARQWAEEIACFAPLSLRASKAMAYDSTTFPEERALNPRTYPSALAVLDSADAREGCKAFLERRRPVWTGH